MDELLSDLLTAIKPDEKSTIDLFIGQIDAAKRSFESSDFPDWQQRLQKVANLRLRSSNTLRCGDRVSWVKANSFVEEQVQARKLPTWSAICEINSILTGLPASDIIRDMPIYIGPLVATAPEKLDEHIQYFTMHILPFENLNRHPLIHAALLQYWLVSIHPFHDANGRTAVLVADWINLYFGYFPQAFEMQVDAVIGHFSNRSSKATPARAVLKVLKNDLTSYEAFLGQNPS